MILVLTCLTGSHDVSGSHILIGSLPRFGSLRPRKARSLALVLSACSGSLDAPGSHKACGSLIKIGSLALNGSLLPFSSLFDGWLAPCVWFSLHPGARSASSVHSAASGC